MEVKEMLILMYPFTVTRQGHNMLARCVLTCYSTWKMKWQKPSRAHFLKHRIEDVGETCKGERYVILVIPWSGGILPTPTKWFQSNCLFTVLNQCASRRIKSEYFISNTECSPSILKCLYPLNTTGWRL